MTEMLLTPAPGICLSASYYSVGKQVAYISGGSTFRQGQNRWNSGYNVEFIAGYPQKIAGWAKATNTMLDGVPRAVRVWRDHTGNPLVGIGTETDLYVMDGAIVTDITPFRSIISGTLTNPVTTTNGSNLVSITDATAVLANGDWVKLTTTTPVGGISLLGWYQVNNFNPGVGYSIVTLNQASTSAGPGGGATTFSYPRMALTDPFVTHIGSTTVNVTHTGHGAFATNVVQFYTGTLVGGLSILGEYTIMSIIDANNYTITTPTPATSTATGGGTVAVTYEIQIQEVTQLSNIGYSDGSYNVGAYSVTGAATSASATDHWSLSAYGHQLLACPSGGSIYVYDPEFGGRAYPLLNAPTSAAAMFVTPERFVVALGVNGNLMQIAWADQNDYTVWSATPTNTANEGRTLVGGSFFVGGVGLRQGVSLIFTDRCVFAMNYTGTQEVYSTLQYGDNCGLVDPTAVAVEGGIAYWMSDNDFWAWNGSATVLPTDDIRESIFGPGNLNRQHLGNCTAMLNRAKRQVRFYFPLGGSMENNAGMIYQYDQQCWSPLNYGRSAGEDSTLLSVPISTDVNGIVYFDETGVDAAGTPLPYFLGAGAIDVSNGDKNVDIMGFTPDYQHLSGTPQLEILTQYYPLQTAVLDGPYTISSSSTRQDLRADGKLFAFTLSDTAIGSNFRLGIPRLDVQIAGARR